MLVQIPHCHQRQGVHSRFLQALPVCPIRACAGSPYGGEVDEDDDGDDDDWDFYDAAAEDDDVYGPGMY